MKRLILAGFIVGLTVSGLCLAGVWSGQANPSTNVKGLGSATLPGMVIQPLWLSDDPNDPNDPNEPVEGIE